MKGAGPLDWHTVDSLVLIGVTDPVEADVGGAKEGRSVGCIARTPRAVRGREANTTVALGHSARATRPEDAPSVSAACRQSRRRGRRTVRHHRLDAPTLFQNRKPAPRSSEQVIAQRESSEHPTSPGPGPDPAVPAGANDCPGSQTPRRPPRRFPQVPRADVRSSFSGRASLP